MRQTLCAIAVSLSMAVGASADKLYKETPNLTQPSFNSVHPEVLLTFSPKIRTLMSTLGAVATFGKLGADTYLQVSMPGSLWADQNVAKELSYAKVYSDEEILEKYAKAVDRLLGIVMTDSYNFSLSTHDINFGLQFAAYHPSKAEDTPAARKKFFAQKYAQCILGKEKDQLLCTYYDILEERIQ